MNLSFRRMGDQQTRFSIPGRWSAHPEPLRYETVLVGGAPSVATAFEPSLVPNSYSLDVAPTGAGQEVAVAVVRDGEAYAFSAESYLYPGWKRPEWRLAPGEWVVEVVASSAQASARRSFRLVVSAGGLELVASDGDTEPSEGDQSNIQPTPGAAVEPQQISRAEELADEALESERTSAENLGARSSWLIGFSGVVLALVAGLNKDTVFSAGFLQPQDDLGAVGEPLSAALAFGAVSLLLVAALVARLAVQPRRRGRVPTALLNDLRTGLVAVGAANADAARLKAQMYAQEAASNDQRGRRLKTAFRLLVAGLVLVSAQAVILFGHRAKVW